MKLLDWIPLEKLDWFRLSENPSPGAIELLEKNPKKIHWDCLSQNPGAIRIIEKNLDKIRWYSFVALFPIVIPALPIAYIYKEINYK